MMKMTVREVQVTTAFFVGYHQFCQWYMQISWFHILKPAELHVPCSEKQTLEKREIIKVLGMNPAQGSSLQCLLHFL